MVLTQPGDLVTRQLDAFLFKHGAQLLEETKPFSLVLRHRIISLQTVSDTAHEVAENLGKVMDQIALLCSKHEFARLLTLFRKMPHQYASSTFVPSQHHTPKSIVNAVFSEAVLFGTNCILKFGRHVSTFLTNNDRYKFSATEEELHDTVRIFLMCVLYRSEIFYMNSINRQELVAPIALEEMLDVYNRRLVKHWNPKLVTEPSRAIIYPAPVNNLPPHARYWIGIDRDGDERGLALRNYFPYPSNADMELQRFAYLDTGDFVAYTGVSFTTFSRVWIGLNQLIFHILPLLWSDTHIFSVAPELLTSKIEQADDYCEAALGGAHPESIWQSCHQLISSEGGSKDPTLEECRTVVDFLTYRRFEGDVRFPEQPYVFYPVSERLLLWDYLRHGALFRCLARSLSTRMTTPTTQNNKGIVFERQIMAALKGTPGVSGVRKWIHRQGGRALWEVDVGFVFEGIIFLIDAKNEQKSVRYYFDGTEVSDKVVKRERFLARLDSRLRQHASHVREAWKEYAPLRGAICLVCTEEAEFVASSDPSMWIHRFDCPRICMLSELLDVLDRHSTRRDILTNPAFFEFPLFQ